MVFLPRMSLGGIFVCTVFALLCDMKWWTSTAWQAFVLLIPYGVLMVLFSCIAVFIQKHVSGVFFNVSLLCTNIYTFAT